MKKLLGNLSYRAGKITVSRSGLSLSVSQTRTAVHLRKNDRISQLATDSWHQLIRTDDNPARSCVTAAPRGDRTIHKLAELGCATPTTLGVGALPLVTIGFL